MADSTSTPISLYHSSTPGAQPVYTNLVDGELAINIYDGKLYYKDNNGDVQLLASKTGSSNVTNVSLVTANGFSGSVANPSTTPAITLTTSITGVLKGSSGALVAASPGVDYAAATTGTSAQLLASNGSGGFSNVTVGSGLTLAAGTLTASGSGSGVSSITGSNLGVSSPTGAVTISLSSTNIGNALGYTPANATGGNASGTWGINISGNAATATSATTASSASFATSAGSATTATSAGSAATATTATNVSGGTVSAPSITATGGTPVYMGTATSGGGGIQCNSYNFTSNTSFYYSGGSVYLATNGLSYYQFNNSGTATAPSWVSTSDSRIKENVATIQTALNAINQLRPIEYSLKVDNLQKANRYGFIAQELEQTYPNLVETSGLTIGGVENVKAVHYNDMVPLLVKAVQELKAEVDALKATK